MPMTRMGDVFGNGMVIIKSEASSEQWYLMLLTIEGSVNSWINATDSCQRSWHIVQGQQVNIVGSDKPIVLGAEIRMVHVWHRHGGMSRDKSHSFSLSGLYSMPRFSHKQAIIF